MSDLRNKKPLCPVCKGNFQCDYVEEDGCEIPEGKCCPRNNDLREKIAYEIRKVRPDIPDTATLFMADRIIEKLELQQVKDMEAKFRAFLEGLEVEEIDDLMKESIEKIHKLAEIMAYKTKQTIENAEMWKKSNNDKHCIKSYESLNVLQTKASKYDSLTEALRAEEICQECGGGGTVEQEITEYVTRDMALDAGDERLEGYPIKRTEQECCPSCNGTGTITRELTDEERDEVIKSFVDVIPIYLALGNSLHTSSGVKIVKGE